MLGDPAEARLDDAYERQAAIRGCLRRLGARYQDASQRGMTGLDREKMRVWFEDRYSYLQQAYRCAINEADNIILFDPRPTLDYGWHRDPHISELPDV